MVFVTLPKRKVFDILVQKIKCAMLCVVCVPKGVSVIDTTAQSSPPGGGHVAYQVCALRTDSCPFWPSRAPPNGGQ